MPAVSETLERTGELDRITAALDAAARGEGRVVVIEGEAGIGKTHLVRATRDLARERGFGRLQAVGDELETAMACNWKNEDTKNEGIDGRWTQEERFQRR
jgi:chromosomal replication initiation ATPase DnaA